MKSMVKSMVESMVKSLVKSVEPDNGEDHAVKKLDKEIGRYD